MKYLEEYFIKNNIKFVKTNITKGVRRICNNTIRITGKGGKHFNINKNKYETELPKLFSQYFHDIFIKPIIKNKREDTEDTVEEDTVNFIIIR